MTSANLFKWRNIRRGRAMEVLEVRYQLYERKDSSKGPQPPAEEEEVNMSDAIASETKRIVLKFSDGAYLYGVKSQSEDSWVELKNGNQPEEG